MAKKVFAVTNIKGNGGVLIEAGGEVDQTVFTPEDLKKLYDVGAIEVRDVPEAEVSKPAETPVETSPKTK